MEVKKTPEADLERKRFTWLLMGGVVALALLFVVFEWSVSEDDGEDLSPLVTSMSFEEDIVPIAMQPFEEFLPPPPVAAPAPVQLDNLQVVEDTAEVAEVDFASTEGPEAQVALLESVETVAAESVSDESVSDEAVDYMYVERIPQFPNGGQAALRRYLSTHIKYPDVALSKGIQGCVVCQFIVNRDGSVVDVKIIQGVDAALDKEAIRVLSAMPRWEPGVQQGKPVRVRFTLPVMFRL